MKSFHFGLAAIVFFIASTPAIGQTLRAVDAADVVDANGVRVGRVQNGRDTVLFEFDTQVFSVAVLQDGFVGTQPLYFLYSIVQAHYLSASSKQSP